MSAQHPDHWTLPEITSGGTRYEIGEYQGECVAVFRIGGRNTILPGADFLEIADAIHKAKGEQ